MVKQADVPEGTIDDVKDWVNADEAESEARAKKALEVENKAEEPRTSLVSWLESKAGVEHEEEPDEESDLSDEEQARLDDDEISHNTHPAGDVGPADFVDPAAEDGSGEAADEALEAESSRAYREGNLLRANQQEVGTESDSAWNVRLALGLDKSDKWDEELDEAIKAYQQDQGQKVTGRITRDQARRLKLSYLG